MLLGCFEARGCSKRERARGCGERKRGGGKKWFVLGLMLVLESGCKGGEILVAGGYVREVMEFE